MTLLLRLLVLIFVAGINVIADAKDHLVPGVRKNLQMREINSGVPEVTPQAHNKH